MNEFQDLIPDFLDESREHLADIEDDILVMETSVQRGDESDPEVINRIFRAIHSIKGGSSFVGFVKIEELSHKMEDLLNFIRNGDIVPDSQAIDVLLKSIDKLKFMIENSSTSNEEDVSEYVNSLIEITNRGLGKDVKESVSKTATTGELLGGYDFTISQYTLERKLAKGSVYLVTVDMPRDVEARGRTILEFIDDAAQVGEILDTYIDIEGIREDSLIVHFLYFSIMEEDLLRMSFDFLTEDKIVSIDKSKLKQLFRKPERADETPPAQPVINAEVNTMAEDNGKKDTLIAAPAEEKPADLLAVALSDSQQDEDESEWEKYNEFVTFYIGTEQYAVPIFLVQEIKEMQPYSYLPNQPDYVIGVVNLRGSLVPIFDLRKKLNVEEKEFDKFTVILILNIKGKIKGCVVDAISDVVLLEHEDKQTTPLLSRNINTDYVRFIGKDSKTDSFLIVLDIEKILEKD